MSNGLLKSGIGLMVAIYLFLAVMQLFACTASRSQDWKPAKVKMSKVQYNGNQTAQGYLGY